MVRCFLAKSTQRCMTGSAKSRGNEWKACKKALEKALLPNQRQDKGNFKGSWDPVGPWGEDGGRVYSTAICALVLEVYYRYAQVLGAR